MRQHGSVLMLLARSTLWKLLGLFLVMAAVEAGLFARSLGQVLGQEMYGLEQVLEGSRLPWVFGAAFLLTAVLLCGTGCEFGSRPGYLLRRLSVSERAVWAWQAGYNACCLFLLWAVQIFLLLALSAAYLTLADPEMVTGQTLVLAAYRNDFFHSLLPLAEALRWVCHLLTVAAFGICSASFPYQQRRRKVPVAAPVCALLILWGLCRPMGGGYSVLACLIPAVCASGLAMVHVLSGKEEPDEV